jgi:predicted RNA-binding Zn ribbon-like protein
MTAAAIDHSHFDLDTGDLSLNFANTLGGRYDPQPAEGLRSYDDLVLFGYVTETLDEAGAARLRQIAAQKPEAAAAALERARALREAIFGVFNALASDTALPGDALATLNGALAAALPHGSIAPRDDGFDWVWEDARDLDRPVWPIAWAAMQLLLHGDRSRLRECAADDCGWLFLDTSRNRSRRWCSMSSCGNRAKVQHFRERQRPAS